MVTIHAFHHIKFVFCPTLTKIDPPPKFVHSNLFISFVKCSGVRSPIQLHFHAFSSLVSLNHRCKNLRPFLLKFSS
jgi:hypothetical protein